MGAELQAAATVKKIVTALVLLTLIPWLATLR